MTSKFLTFLFGIFAGLVFPIVYQLITMEFQSFNDHQMLFNAIAPQGASKIKLFCLIMTSAEFHESRAAHVKATWAPRCDHYVFASSSDDPTLPTLKLNVGETRDWLWAKTKLTFKYAWEQHGKDFDWFLKADDDTYVIIENLRTMLAAYNPQDPIYFGCHFTAHLLNGFMAGGAGYVLSREALRRFVETALKMNDSTKCSTENDGNEDVEMGRCLTNVGVVAGDSRDKFGRHRFLPYSALYHMRFVQMDSKAKWLSMYSKYPIERSMNCCSNHAIAFHDISEDEMYAMEYMIYHLEAQK